MKFNMIIAVTFIIQSAFCTSLHQRFPMTEDVQIYSNLDPDLTHQNSYFTSLKKVFLLSSFLDFPGIKDNIINLAREEGEPILIIPELKYIL